MTKLRYIALCVAGASALALSAQEKLTKEIDIDREIVPELRAASRMDVYPATVRPDFKEVTLPEGTLTDAVAYTPLWMRYEPASAGLTALPTPWRGYVDAGYFPVKDFGLSAGYAPVATKNTLLRVFTDIHRRQWDDKISEEVNPSDYMTFDACAGVGFRHNLPGSGTLSLSAVYNFSQYNKTLSVHDQKLHRFSLDAGWDGLGRNDLIYKLGLGMGIHNYTQGAFPYDWMLDIHPDGQMVPVDDDGMLKPVHETSVKFLAGASLLLSSARVGVDISGDFLLYNRFADRALYETLSSPALTPAERVIAYMAEDGKSLGVLSLTPYYNIAGEIGSLRVGARLDVIVNSGRVLHVAPDIVAALNPAYFFGAWVRLGGGEVLNSQSRLWAISRYTSPMWTYRTSNLPLTAQVGLRVGPWRGFSLEVGGDWADAHRWLLPTDVASRMWIAHNLHSFRIFAGLTARWGELIEFKGRFERRLGSAADNMWYEWADGAQSVAKADVTVRPVKRLSINLGVDARLKREFAREIVDESLPVETEATTFVNLHAGAQYGFTDALSVFARVDNILNQHKRLIFDAETVGINGLVGVAYKF